MINVEIDQVQLAKVEFMLVGIENGASTVLLRAINRTLTGAKTDLDRATRKILNIKSGRVKKDMYVRQASIGRLSGRVGSCGRPVGLTQFTGTKQTKTGVSVSVRKDTPRKVIKRAFIADGRNDNTHVFWRKWHEVKRGRRNVVYAKLPRKYRHPIKSLYGPRIQDIQSQPEVTEPVQAQATVRLKKRIDHELTYLLRKYND